jgi:hypothetical protein
MAHINIDVLDIGNWQIDQLETIIAALSPGETIEDFVLKAALERYDRQKNVVTFKPRPSFKLKSLANK